MAGWCRCVGGAAGGVGLRTELSLRGMRFAAAHGLIYERTDGAVPSVIFAHGEDGRHGNFHPAAYEAICSRPEWKRRLGKVHTAHKRVRARADWQWMELDCANSSDALLMNVFCHPGVVGWRVCGRHWGLRRVRCRSLA